MTELDIKNPGHELRTSRERLGLSINDVAVATKINPRILKALEEGDRTSLPAKSFARGFIRSYANYLKIDPSPILIAYDGHAESGVKDLTQKAENKIAAIEIDTVTNSHSHSDKMAAEEPRSSNNKVSDARARNSFGERSVASRIVVFAVIFVLVGLVIFVKKVKDKYEREKVTGDAATSISAIEPDASSAANSADGVAGSPGDDVAPEPADATTATATATPAPTAADKSSLAAPVSIAEKVDAKPADKGLEKPAEKATEKPPEKVAEKPATLEVKPSAPLAAMSSAPSDKLVSDADKVAADKLAADKIKSDKAAERAAKKAAAVAAATSTDSTATPVTVAADAKVDVKAAKKSQEIIIEALDAVDLTIQVDGEPVKSVHLNPETLHTIKAKGNVEVDIADGGMVNIVYNGLDKGVPGQLGKPIKLKYP